MITEKEKEYKKKYYLKNKDRIAKYRFNNKEYMSKYSKEYYLNNKESKAKYDKEYRLNNREHLTQGQKEYNLNNKENISKYKKKYYLNNKEHIIKVTSAWDREQRKNNPNYKLRRNLRSRVYSALKGSVKSTSTMELIGCSVDKLWNHLESQFESWMTKENYGLWHVDHIKACAKFDLTCPEQQRICFNYKNLQPMEAIENIRKGAR